MTQRTILITRLFVGHPFLCCGLRNVRTRAGNVYAACRQELDCRTPREEGFDSPPPIDYNRPCSINHSLGGMCWKNTGGTPWTPYSISGAIRHARRGRGPAHSKHCAEIFEAKFSFFGWHTHRPAQSFHIMRAQGHGRIVQCSSVLGLVALPWRGAVYRHQIRPSKG